MIWQSVNRKRKRKKFETCRWDSSSVCYKFCFAWFIIICQFYDEYGVYWYLCYAVTSRVHIDVAWQKRKWSRYSTKKFVFRHWFFFSSPDDLNSFICFLHIWTVILPVLFSPFVLLKDTCPLMAASSGGLWEV